MKKVWKENYLFTLDLANFSCGNNGLKNLTSKFELSLKKLECWTNYKWLEQWFSHTFSLQKIKWSAKLKKLMLLIVAEHLSKLWEADFENHWARSILWEPVVQFVASYFCLLLAGHVISPLCNLIKLLHWWRSFKLSQNLLTVSSSAISF